MLSKDFRGSESYFRKVFCALASPVGPTINAVIASEINRDQFQRYPGIEPIPYSFTQFKHQQLHIIKLK